MNYSKINNEILLEIRNDVAGLRERQLVHEEVLIGHNHRFDALDVRLDPVETRLDHLEVRMDVLEKRMNTLEKRMDALEKCMDALELRMDRIESKLDKVIGLLINEREERMAMMSVLVSHDKRLNALESTILT